MKNRVIIFIGCLLALWGVSFAHSETQKNETAFQNGYTVTGKLYFTLPVMKGRTNASTVTFYYNKGDWKMLILPEEMLSPAEALPPKPVEYGSRYGTNTYELAHFAPSNEEPAPSNEHSLNIYSGKVPAGYRLLWAAFCAGEYLGGKNGAGDIEPPFSAGIEFQKRKMKVPAQWTIHDESATFPMLESYRAYHGEERCIYVDGIYKKEKVSQANIQTIDAEYHVQEWTNILGQDFPLKAIIHTSHLGTGPREEIMNTTSWIEVDNIVLGVPDNIFQFNVPDKTWVGENRLLAEGNIPVTKTYLSDTGELQSLTDITQDIEFQVAVSAATMDENTPERNISWVYVITFFVLIFPFFIYWYKNKNIVNK